MEGGKPIHILRVLDGPRLKKQTFFYKREMICVFLACGHFQTLLEKSPTAG